MTLFHLIQLAVVLTNCFCILPPYQDFQVSSNLGTPGDGTPLYVYITPLVGHERTVAVWDGMPWKGFHAVGPCVFYHDSSGFAEP